MQITEGLILMATGMGFVIVFLTLLVIILNILAKFAGTPDLTAETTGLNHDTKLKAVLAAAVHHHRKQGTGENS